VAASRVAGMAMNSDQELPGNPGFVLTSD